MKILHVCMNVPYMDGWGYQENLLPLYLYKEGVDSVVVSSAKLPPLYLKGHCYPVGETYIDGVKIIRIKCYRIKNALTFTRGLYKTLKKEKPDVIMHHNPNFTSLVVSSIYCQLNGIKMVVDNHADYINCVQNKLYQFIFYRLMVGTVTNIFSGPIIKYYGVTYSRCDFLRDVFCVKKSKIDFLPIGTDEDLVEKLPSKEEIRDSFNVPQDSFVVITGGKMGKGKGTPNLIRAIEKLADKGHNIKLILFGLFEDNDTEKMSQDVPFAKSYGWCDRERTLQLLKMADVACWPIHHTTLCEDAIACGTPLIIRETQTTKHLIEGNGEYVRNGTEEELEEAISKFLKLDIEGKKDISKAVRKMQQKLSYHSIAKKLINDVNKYNNE